MECFLDLFIFILILRLFRHFLELETVDRLWKFSSFTQSMDEFSPQKKTENPSDTVPNSHRFPWFPFCFIKFASYLGKYKQKQNRAEVHSRAWRNCVCSCQMVACSVKSRGRVTHGIPWKFPMISLRSSLYSQIPVQKDMFLDSLHIYNL